MKKKVAKVFKKYGEKKIKLIKDYAPKSKRVESTAAIKGSRRDIYKAIGNVILKASKEEQKLVGDALKGDFFEDWDGDTKQLIKY